jgi:hypothetical protein
MGKRKKRRTRKKKENYLWKGIKGLFYILWVCIREIAIGIYKVFNWVGFHMYSLALRLKQGNQESIATKAVAEHPSKNSKKENPHANHTPKPGQGKTKAELVHLDVIEAVHGKIEDFEYWNGSQIILIFGKRGSGKSTLGFRLMENIHAKKKRPCYVIGVGEEFLPEWISEVEHVDDAKNGGIVLVDEGAISFSSRESMKTANKDLGKLLAIARHKGLTLLFITQNTGMIDKNVLNLTDVIIAKEGSLLQKKMERPVVRDFVSKADTAIKAMSKPERVAHSYIFSDDYEGLVRVSLPTFWNEDISKNQR